MKAIALSATAFIISLIRETNPPYLLSCHAFKFGISSEQDARTTGIAPLLILRFKCRTAYPRLRTSVQNKLTF